MSVPLQLQIYILAALIGAVIALMTWILAAICGNISKLKQHHRQLERYMKRQSASYDNHAYTSPTIQPDEELNRRGYSMYPYTTSITTNASNLNNRKGLSQPISNSSDSRDDDPNILNANGSREASAEFSNVYLYQNGNEAGANESDSTELKTFESSNYPPQYHGVPPPPAFVNHFNETNENGEQSTNTKSSAH